MGAIWAAVDDPDRNGWAIAAIVAALAGVTAVLAVFVRVLTNRRGALDRTVDRLSRSPAGSRGIRSPEHLRRSQQFTAAGGAALLVAVALLLFGLLMDQFGR